VAAMFAGGTTAAVLAGAFGTAQALVTPPTWALPAGALFLGLLLALGFLAGNAALQYGAARLPAQTTALVMLSEVLFATVSSVLAGASELTGRILVGGALVVAAAAWSGWAERAEPRTIAA